MEKQGIWGNWGFWDFLKGFDGKIEVRVFGWVVDKAGDSRYCWGGSSKNKIVSTSFGIFQTFAFFTLSLLCFYF